MAPDDPSGRAPGSPPTGPPPAPDPFAPLGFGGPDAPPPAGVEPGWPSTGAGPDQGASQGRASASTDQPLELDAPWAPPVAPPPAAPSPPVGLSPAAWSAVYGEAAPPGAPYAPATPPGAAGPSAMPPPGASSPYGAPPDGLGAYAAPSGAPGPYGAPPGLGAQALCAVHPATPAVGLCPRCGAYMCAWCQRINDFGEIFCATCMERVGGGAPVPWDRRAELGTWPAFWQTFKESVMQPDDFFARASHGLTTDPPLLYAMICGWLGQLGYAVVRLAMKEQPFIILLSFATVPVGVLLSIYVGGGIAHLFARMFGGQGTYAATARNWGFCHSPSAMGLIPLLGAVVAGVWTIVLEVYAVKHAHRLSGGKAAAAVLVPMGILLVLCCGVAVAIGAAVGGLAAARGGWR